MDIKTNIIISGIRLKYPSEKRNEYNVNRMFQVLGERQLGQIYNLAEANMKMPIWIYNENLI